MNSLLPSRRVLLEAIVLVMVAVAAGLSLNYKIVMKAFSGRSLNETVMQQKVSAPERLPLPVDFADLDTLLAAGAIFVDARDTDLYRDNHLPGALSLPLGRALQDLAHFQSQVPQEQVLITYCSGFGCPDSFDLGLLLLKAGYVEVWIYEGGYPEWRDRGRPLETGEAK